jgi:hypothetical protein
MGRCAVHERQWLQQLQQLNDALAQHERRRPTQPRPSQRAAQWAAAYRALNDPSPSGHRRDHHAPGVERATVQRPSTAPDSPSGPPRAPAPRHQQLLSMQKTLRSGRVAHPPTPI